MAGLTLVHYVYPFALALKRRMQEDQLRWGDTWKKRPVEGQEERVFARYQDYIDQYRERRVPVPWLKIAGEALIAWVRETYPDYAELDDLPEGQLAPGSSALFCNWDGMDAPDGGRG